LTFACIEEHHPPMSRYRRSTTPGATFFFTVATYKRQPILTQPHVRAALRDAIEQVRGRLPFLIDAWVLLPDHLHAIWTLPRDDAAYGKRWGMIKSYVSRRCEHLLIPVETRSASRIKRREADFWQRRFWEHQIRDDRDFERCVDYIHYNPVKHRLVPRVKEWPYSTFHQYVSRGLYAENWSTDPGVVDAGVRE
jgi:putative transposase